MSLRDLVDGEAMMDDDENDEEVADDFDNEVREGAGTANHYNDSSEEDDEEEDDEEAARAVREGFIVDEDEEIDDRRRHHKGKRSRPREEEHLDEEDLELIGEVVPGLSRSSASENKFKRLKRGKDRDNRQQSQGIDAIFNSDDEEETEQYRPTGGRNIRDEFDDFIEEDTFSDEEGQRERDDLEVAPAARGAIPGLGASEVAGLDENALEDMRAAFGDGTEYTFALDIEDQEEEDKLAEERHLDLKDVFEPSELAERMLTEEDNEIRGIDEPERHQIARKPYKHVVLTEDQFREEAIWISNQMIPRRAVAPELCEPFQRSVAKMLEFLVTDDWEVPFIFQHRKDHMIHAVKEPINGGDPNDESPQYRLHTDKLLHMSDLWEIFDYDLKFRSFVDKRTTIQSSFDGLRSLFGIEDSNVEDALVVAATMEELQDVSDYIHFQYASQLRDMSAVNGEANGGHQRRKATSKTLYERVRNSKAYGLVRAFGISAHDFAQNASKEGRRQYTEDPSEGPEQLADQFVDEDFASSSHVLKAAKSMFTEELALNPKMRKVLRQVYYQTGVVDCHRTEKGLRRIDEHHPYYEFKYRRNLQLTDIAVQPELFLRMLKAEEEGLVQVNVRFQNFDETRQRLYKDIESDNISEVADAWNALRREALDAALVKLERSLNRGLRENLRQECEKSVINDCRETFGSRLDQAPYKPKGMVLGTVPRTLTLTYGDGDTKKPIYWAYTEEDGRVLESGKFKSLTPGDKNRGVNDAEHVAAFVDLVERRKPDVIGVSGLSLDTRYLYKDLTELVESKDLRGAPYTDERDQETSDILEVVVVNDEVARLYSNSSRAEKDNPGFDRWTHYCVALGRYLQSPLKEYASLGKDLLAIPFKPGQQLVSQDLLQKQFDTALVDMVNLVGVDLNEAVNDPATASLLPYVCGLGPRKAAHLLKIINMNGGSVNNRVELLGVNAQYPAMGVKVWNNCASFVFIDFENADPDADPLDNTRVHPEDYDIARKMAADALELDEEDIKTETDENGSGAIVRKLFREEQQDRVNDLILEEYAEQLEKNLNQRKRATLETIRAELQQPYEELRKQFVMMNSDDIFTMLTGETSETLAPGTVVSFSIHRVYDDHLDGILECGLSALVSESELGLSHDLLPTQVFERGDIRKATIIFVNKKTFSCNVSLRPGAEKNYPRRRADLDYEEWDAEQERKDQESLKETKEQGGQALRVIKHPLFRPFNSVQAEEYLGSRARGDVVIRPSSRGKDHLAVTWKVSQGVYQHIDVLELDKENDFSVGRILKVAGKYTYSDLDDLIVNHVKAMARKVEEMMLNEKFQDGSKAETDQWLETYTKANPRRSAYAFCINTKYPGYFYLCFKAGEHSRVQNWPVKVIPQGYELQRNPYTDMQNLCNGFKLLFKNVQSRQ
ncbi:hypothetical protein N7532_001322 [Penicillium argentinense]|uniref:Transcription elongation factor Spt6 n=1 Tax=Penicillium argentinense TaxID=1131581 RepID=A0A9W9G2D6_9EURO|nr:uncharacterized protein N7532_001322 [Penicillium argentinense]KAJ5110787.1 hypothetical protein N7532_001322 [Penicillium argentinense]